MSGASEQGPERIAVVGMACRFPGAPELDAFWGNLRDGVESIAFFTEEELREGGTDPALLRHPEFVRAFGYLEGADLFDADFFDLPPRDAELMDPQHRLFLEEAWRALEHAGIDPDTHAGPIGVFAGSNMNTYLLNLVARHGSQGGDLLQNRIRSDKDFLTTLASYKLNLRGPSFAVQTACSTSLVAIHLACQSLLDYQCDAALAGGISVGVPLRSGYMAREGVFAPDGHCRAFDAKGEGTVGGSGVGVVVLKRLSDALADGDRVHAVILGSAVNNDGAAKVGYSAPSVDGQIEVVAMAHAVADVPAETVTYVEAHGTATPLGDPVEVAALTKAFATEERGFCALGSVKTNIGHLDAAAGVASLIKTVLSLEHGEIPASLHFTAPNPKIDFERSPFFVADRRLPWTPPAGVPRRAGVSSFGVGGTNAHVVLEEAPPAPAPPLRADGGAGAAGPFRAHPGGAGAPFGRDRGAAGGRLRPGAGRRGLHPSPRPARLPGAARPGGGERGRGRGAAPRRRPHAGGDADRVRLRPGRRLPVLRAGDPVRGDGARAVRARARLPRGHGPLLRPPPRRVGDGPALRALPGGGSRRPGRGRTRPARAAARHGRPRGGRPAPGRALGAPRHVRRGVRAGGDVARPGRRAPRRRRALAGRVRGRLRGGGLLAGGRAHPGGAPRRAAGAHPRPHDGAWRSPRRRRARSWRSWRARGTPSGSRP